MALFDREPIADGFGFYHINRFRICLKPSGPSALASLQANLIASMPFYMDPDTAKVVSDGAHPWEGRPTLMFYGIPVIRPFDGSIAPYLLPPGLRELAPLIPKEMRGIKLPALHTDSVGILKESVTSTGFTVQTLKRNFETGEDLTIRGFLNATIDTIVEVQRSVNPLVAFGIEKIKPKLIDYAIWVNQHHFLAGRRSFRFVPGKALGYTDDRIVFETAAVERYAKFAFAAPTEVAMGGDKKSLEVVWVEMVTNLACDLTIVPPRSNHPTLGRDPTWVDTGISKNKNVLEFYAQTMSQGSVMKEAGSLFAKPELHPLLFQP